MSEIHGKGIEELVPQRAPMVMIDAFYGATETEADTGLTVSEDNIFCVGGHFAEPGLVEHIAQSTSAFAGYKAKMQNKPAPIGLLGEVRKLRINFLPEIGNELRTHIRIVSEVSGVFLLTAETKVGRETAVQGQIKIFIQPS